MSTPCELPPHERKWVPWSHAHFRGSLCDRSGTAESSQRSRSDGGICRVMGIRHTQLLISGREQSTRLHSFLPWLGLEPKWPCIPPAVASPTWEAMVPGQSLNSRIEQSVRHPEIKTRHWLHYSLTRAQRKESKLFPGKCNSVKRSSYNTIEAWNFYP